MIEEQEGLEELADLRQGEALQAYRNTGRYVILKGKYRGSFVDTIPRGYIRKVVLDKWDLTDDERAIFEYHGVEAKKEP